MFNYIMYGKPCMEPRTLSEVEHSEVEGIVIR